MAKITKYDLEQMKSKFIEGMYCKTPKGEARIIHKYPHYASTETGNWKWIEIYLAEHGMRCDDRVKLIKEIPKNANVNV